MHARKMIASPAQFVGHPHQYFESDFPDNEDREEMDFLYDYNDDREGYFLDSYDMKEQYHTEDS